MKKSKLIAILATVLSVAVIATACKSSEETKKKSKKTKADEDIEDIDDDDDDDDDDETKKTKKTKKTKETTEEPTEEPTTTTTEEETTTTTTEEPTTTTTTEATTSATDATTVDLGDKVQHSVGVYNYAFSKDWQFKEQSGYQYFFKDLTDADNFMMIYKQHLMSATQLQSYGYEKALDEFNAGLVSSFGGGKLESCTKTDGGDKEIYEDIVITGDYSGKAKKLPMRIYMDKETGDCYVFVMFMDANLDSGTESEIMDKYNGCIASITRG